MSVREKHKTKYERPCEKFSPPEILPNRLRVPPNTLLCLSEHDAHYASVPEVIDSLKTHKKRDWMNQHTYFCLPLTMGNQYGFVIRAVYDFELYWDGGETPSSLQIRHGEDYLPNGKQIISSHFGMGIVTLQNRFSLRTPEGVNLVVMNPPNYFIDGLQSLTAVVEADNLRRDFTFNLKVTRPHHWIRVEKGQPVSAVLPYPRRFVDGFDIALAKDVIAPDVIEEERRTSGYFARERSEIDSQYRGGNGYRYLDGEDIYGIPFKDHQKKLGD